MPWRDQKSNESGENVEYIVSPWEITFLNKHDANKLVISITISMNIFKVHEILQICRKGK